MVDDDVQYPIIADTKPSFTRRPHPVIDVLGGA